ncbi:MAG TPA: zinc ribbon domain-containing protein [Candidatus Rifleibacterium sp.]|nr:zinc ribbon domain-containing protein [Candidatus Rifleibacterium sp.]
MPFYTYKARDQEQSCDYCRESFEIFQKIKEDTLETCPECENQIVRIMHPAAQGRDDSTKKLLSDDNLKKHGFKKLVNRGGGKFDEVV